MGAGIANLSLRSRCVGDPAIRIEAEPADIGAGTFVVRIRSALHTCRKSLEVGNADAVRARRT
jgi:hypothetical protein